MASAYAAKAINWQRKVGTSDPGPDRIGSDLVARPDSLVLSFSILHPSPTPSYSLSVYLHNVIEALLCSYSDSVIVLMTIRDELIPIWCSHCTRQHIQSDFTARRGQRFIFTCFQQSHSSLHKLCPCKGKMQPRHDLEREMCKVG